MNSRPFYRSLVFWFGLPLLVFLLWVWWFSMGHYIVAEFDEAYRWQIWLQNGSVDVTWDSAGWPDWQQFHWRCGETTGLFGSKIFWKAPPTDGPSVHYAFVPYHRLVLAYAATWLLTLALWRRRKARLLKLYTAP